MLEDLDGIVPCPDGLTSPNHHSRTFKAISLDHLRNLMLPRQLRDPPRSLEVGGLEEPLAHEVLEPWVLEVLEVLRMRMEDSAAEVVDSMDSDVLVSLRRWRVWGPGDLEQNSCA